MKIKIGRNNQGWWNWGINNEWNSEMDLFRSFTLHLGPVFILISR